jgi:hypothetical protein
LCSEHGGVGVSLPGGVVMQVLLILRLYCFHICLVDDVG